MKDPLHPPPVRAFPVDLYLLTRRSRDLFPRLDPGAESPNPKYPSIPFRHHHSILILFRHFSNHDPIHQIQRSSNSPHSSFNSIFPSYDRYYCPPQRFFNNILLPFNQILTSFNLDKTELNTSLLTKSNVILETVKLIRCEILIHDSHCLSTTLSFSPSFVASVSFLFCLCYSSASSPYLSHCQRPS